MVARGISFVESVSCAWSDQMTDQGKSILLQLLVLCCDICSLADEINPAAGR
jgi:hypothetical protein